VTLSGERVPGEFIWNVRQLIHCAGLRYHKKSTMSAARSKSPASLSSAKSSRRTANF
jgi:hypothetical protein